MAVNLKKGERTNLTSQGGKVHGIIVGLGWDSAKFGGAAVDCDVSAILCGADGKAQDVIFFGKMRSENDAVVYTGDSRTGEGDGENEQIYVNFTKLPTAVSKLVICANIYDAKAKRQHFGMISNAFVQVRNWKTGEVLCRFNLTDNYSGMSGIITAEILRGNGDWVFVPNGAPVQEASRVESIVKLYR